MPSQPSGQAMHYSRPLSNISTAYWQESQEFVADKIFSVVPVSKQADQFYRYKKDDWLRVIAAERAPATESAGGGYEVDRDSYYAPVIAVHKDIADQDRANADSQFNLDRDATTWATQQILLKRDRVFTNTFFKTGVWGADVVGVAGAPAAGQFKQWDVAGSDPIELMRREKRKIRLLTGRVPNVLAVGVEALDALKDHASILERIKYTQRGQISNELIASLFEVDRVVEVGTVENIAPEGAAYAGAFQMSKSALLCYANPSPGLMQPSAGYIFGWTGLLGGGAFGATISKFRMDLTKSDRVEAESAYAMKVVGADLGTYFSGAVA